MTHGLSRVALTAALFASVALPAAAEQVFNRIATFPVAANLPADIRQKVTGYQGLSKDDYIRWHKILAAKGWSVPHWPVEWGGTGWTARQHDIFASELAAADAPRLSPLGLVMAAPVLIAFGTQQQKERWLPDIRNGVSYWCQGYSEPGSGSDLASLQCRARREGNEWVINGSKIWTTHAHHADWIFALVRTDATVKKQAGISFLLVPMDQPGVEVTPIYSMSGDHEVNAVFFTDARTPAHNRIGEGVGTFRDEHIVAIHQVHAFHCARRRHHGLPMRHAPPWM